MSADFQLPRKEISEIVQRLTREPSIREMYVEGIFDRDFYKSALRAFGINDVQVYAIDSVNVPIDILKKYNLTDGSRQRVQGAALQMGNATEIHNQIFFLIDADLDYIAEIPSPSIPLARTDGTAAELIFWNKNILENFFEIALARQDATYQVGKVMPFVEGIACDSFIFRAAKYISEKNWSHVELSEAFSSNVDFCINSYMEKCASRNSDHKSLKDTLIPLMEKLRVMAVNLKIHQKMQGHDILTILSKKLRMDGFKQGCLKDPDELSRMIMASVDWKSIAADKTLKLIKDRFPKKIE